MGNVNIQVQLIDEDGHLLPKESFTKYMVKLKHMEFHFLPTSEPGDIEHWDELLTLVLEVVTTK
jgi:hypothetical protein